jgi:hypothetical protein
MMKNIGIINKGAKTKIQDTMVNPFLQIHTKTNRIFINILIP